MKLVMMQKALGPLQTNAIVIYDEDSKQAVAIDPSFQPEPLIEWAMQEGATISQIWITHGHPDHTGGVPALLRALSNSPQILISQEAYEMTQRQGKAFYGLALEPFPEPSRFIEHGDKLGFSGVDEEDFIAEVRFAPGHAPGSVVFYVPETGMAVVGDVIFLEGIGRWDFEGGDLALLRKSIREQVFTLPDETVLLPGHGPATSVAWEKAHNPYMK